MADKFSVDDILSEYSDKVKQNAETEENNIPEEKKEELSEQNSKDIESSDLKNNTSEENAAVISNLSKLKKQKTVSENSQNVPPVNRASLKNMNLGLTGKIIPKTEELDKTEIPDNATYEEKSSILSEHRKKKVENFVLKTNDEDEENEETPKGEKKVSGQKEFESFDEAPKILGDILQVKNNLLVRLVVLLFTGIFSTLITVANDFELPLIKTFDRSISPSAYLFTNTILGLISIAVSYTVLLAGIKNLFKRKADCDSIAAVSVFVSVISGIITLFDPETLRDGHFHVYISAAIVGLIFNTIGKLMIVRRTEQNFRYVAGEYERYAVKTVDNENVASNFTRGSLNDFPELATMRKTEFVDDFMKNSYSSDVADSFAQKTSPLILIAGAVIGLISFLFDKTAADFTTKIFTALAAFSGTVAMCSSVSLMLVVNVPLSRSSKKFLRFSGVMLGYSAVEEFADTNSVLVEAEQLFPNGMVDFVNLKMLSTNSVEECILMAASLACQAGSILKPTFYKMLRGKTEMLYPVESYIYEDGLGLSGWIENKRILLGTRELMQNHSIDGLPSLAKEKEYAKNGNTPIYLSISGVVSTLFVAQINPSLSVSRWLQEFEKEGITTVIRTIDGFLSIDFLAKLFDVSKSSLKLLPFRYHRDYEKETEYVPRMSSSIICSGHFPSFAMLIIGAKRLKMVSNLGIAVQFGAVVLGAVLALIMMITGAFSQITPSVVLCYNLVFVLLTLFIPKIGKI